MLITRNAIWHRVSPAPPVPTQANDSLSTDRGGAGVVDELDDSPAQMSNLDVTWRLDLGAFLQERAQQAPLERQAGDGTAETMGSFQGGAVGASLTPIGRAETADPMGLSQRGAAGASSVPAERAESDPALHQPPKPAKKTVRIPPRFCPGGQHTSAAAADSSPRQYGAGPGARANAWRANLLRTS